MNTISLITIPFLIYFAVKLGTAPQFPLVAMLVFMLSMLFKDNYLNLISIRYFLTKGILFWMIISIFIFLLALQLIGTNSRSIIWGYVIFSFVWIGYSTLANNKVSRLANFLISSGLAILVLLKDFVLSILPDEYIIQQLGTLEGYSGSQEAEIIANVILIPILIINIIAMSICELKGYWIEKYNDGKDVGDE